MPSINRRQFLAAGLGASGLVASGVGLGAHVWPLLAREDLVPGEAPTQRLQPHAWTEDAEHVRIAVLGDNGSGGRQAMAVADELAEAYQEAPFGVVALLGDICYYGRFASRFDDVFTRPMSPLIDAGVRFELAIGNHDSALHHTDASLEEIEDQLRLLGTPGRYYQATHGPVDLFYLDSSVPGLFGTGSDEQLEWLDDALASATSQWKVVALHHPIYSSGTHGGTPGADLLLEPILRRRHVDLVLSGHDHDYERTVPIDGVTYVVSGGGCKITPVGRSSFTAVSHSTLEFVLLDVQGDALQGSCVQPDGSVVDRFTLRAREGR